MKSIKRIRILLGKTQAEIANSAGITRSHLSEIERGRKQSSLKALEAIAKSMGLNAWQLLYIDHHAKTIESATKLLSMAKNVQLLTTRSIDIANV